MTKSPSLAGTTKAQCFIGPLVLRGKPEGKLKKSARKETSTS